jgi:hypothetical protein
MRLAPWVCGLGFLLVGCPNGSSDPPPPPSKPEIPQAPPQALGALAGGTDAAPRPERTPGVEMAPGLPSLPPGHGKASPPLGGGGSGGAPAAAEPDPGVAL